MLALAEGMKSARDCRTAMRAVRRSLRCASISGLFSRAMATASSSVSAGPAAGASWAASGAAQARTAKASAAARRIGIIGMVEGSGFGSCGSGRPVPPPSEGEYGASQREFQRVVKKAMAAAIRAKIPNRIPSAAPAEARRLIAVTPSASSTNCQTRNTLKAFRNW